MLAVSQVAGYYENKKHLDIIPMCHPIMLKSGVDIKFILKKELLKIQIIIQQNVSEKQVLRNGGTFGSIAESLTIL